MTEATRTAPASQPPAAAVPGANAAPAVDPRSKMEPVPSNDKVAKYKLTEPAYIGESRKEVGATIFWDAKPEYYMHPMNAAARNAVREHKPEWKDPFDKLPVAPEPTAIT